MKCRNCKRIIQDNSLFCNWCGADQLGKVSYHVPEPVQRDGYFSGRITVDGKKITVKGKTKKEYIQNVQLIKSGEKPQKPTPTLQQAITDYINSNSETLSPSTLRGYDQILRNRFKDSMPKAIDSIDYQKMVNQEAKECSPKTIKNSWGLVSASLRYADYNIQTINLPKVPIPETDFLDHKQIKIFLQAIRGDDAEAAAILALHSLRASELYHLTADDISNNTIHVHGATVRNKSNQWVDKETNKNRTSTRDIPVIIPRLLELLPDNGKIVTIPPDTVRRNLIKICKDNKLPIVSLHDLRRTFASVTAYLQWHEENICAAGGWKPGSPIVHDIYIKTSDSSLKEDVQKMTDFLKVDTK